MRTEIWVHKVPFQLNRVFTPIALDNTTSKLAIIEPPKFMEAHDGDFIPTESSFHLDETASQKLMDMLWDTGIRPSAGSGSAGQLSSIQYHLEDMRKLVFGNGRLVNK
jgi:hypothetical protein